MMTKKRFLKTFLFSFLLVALISCGDDDDRQLEEMNLRLDSLSNALQFQKRTADSLKLLLEKSEIAGNFPIVYGEKFRGIEDPEAFIKNELRERPELIPLDPVLGGDMEFRKVQIVSEDWVLAVYDDGHRQGKTIFKYILGPEGGIEFIPVVSKLPE